MVLCENINKIGFAIWQHPSFPILHRNRNKVGSYLQTSILPLIGKSGFSFLERGENGREACQKNTPPPLFGNRLFRIEYCGLFCILGLLLDFTKKNKFAFYHYSDLFGGIGYHPSLSREKFLKLPVSYFSIIIKHDFGIPKILGKYKLYKWIGLGWYCIGYIWML